MIARLAMVFLLLAIAVACAGELVEEPHLAEPDPVALTSTPTVPSAVQTTDMVHIRDVTDRPTATPKPTPTPEGTIEAAIEEPTGPPPTELWYGESTPLPPLTSATIQLGCDAAKRLQRIVAASDLEGLEWAGPDLAWFMVNTNAPNLDTLGVMLGEDMVAFSLAPSEWRHEDLVFGFDTYLLTCESMGFPAQD